MGLEYKKPIPVPSDESRPYWDGLREQKLMLPRCRACRRAFLYPRVLCPFCHGPDIEWVQASGRGKEVFGSGPSSTRPSTKAAMVWAGKVKSLPPRA